MKRSRWFIGACIGLALLGAIGGWAAVTLQHEDTWTDPESDFGGPRSLDELNAWAPVIVIALAGDAREVPVNIASGEDGSVTSRRVDEVRSFKVERILKQDRSLPPEIEVRAALSMKTWEKSETDGTTSDFGKVPVVAGRRYVLFLTTFSGTTTGDALGYAGPIAAAELEQDDARFLVSSGLPEEIVPAFARQDVSLSSIEKTIREPQPTPGGSVSGSSDPNSVYAKSFATLIDQGSAVNSVADAERLLTDLGMAPGSLHEPLFCRKVEAVLFDISGHRVDMKCR